MQRAAAAFAILILLGMPVRAEEPVGGGRTQRPELVSQRRHASSVLSITFSRDDRLVLTASADGTARLWEMKTGRMLRVFRGHTDWVATAVFSTDDSRILTASHDNTARLWDANTGEELHRYEGHQSDVKSAVLSPDGRHVLTASCDGTACLWETDTCREVQRYEGHPSFVFCAVFSPDGRYALTAGRDPIVRMWETKTAREVLRLQGHTDWVTSVAFSGDGRRAVTASRDGTARLWDVASGRELRRLEGHSALVSSATLSRDGRFVLTASADKTALLWEAETGRVVQRFDGHSDWVRSATLCADGLLALTAGDDGTARLWEVASGEELRRYEGRASGVNEVSVSSAGRHVLFTGGSTARLWDVTAGGEVRRIHATPVTLASGALSPDGRWVLTGDTEGGVRLWDADTCREVRRYAGHEGAVTSAKFSPDGRHVLTSGFEKVARLWDTETGREEARYVGHAGSIDHAFFSSDGARILTSSMDGTARLWESATGREVRRFGDHVMVWAAALSPDDRQVLTAGFDGDVRLWEATTGRELGRLDGHTKTVFSATFSRDGRQILTSSADGTARLWDRETRREVRRFDVRSGYVVDAIFAARGQWVLTAHDDGTVRFWDVGTGEEICALLSFRDGSWAVVAPDGRFDAGDLEEMEGLHWVMPDDPMQALSVEALMRDYYEPDLLPRLLAGEPMRPVKDPTALNRAQPFVEILEVRRDRGKEHAVSVTVEVWGQSHAHGPPGSRKVSHSGVHDLKLFRDGQIVGWRDGVIAEGTAAEMITFEGIRMPLVEVVTEVVFSAYAFNADGVKSRTHRRSYGMSPTDGPHRGTAYVVAFGVDRFADPRWNLSYAAADACLLAQAVNSTLEETGDWARVVPLLLTSTADRERARKMDLQAVLEALAGKPAGIETVERIPALAQVERARPEDLVIFAVSTHGIATEDGGFLLLPADVSEPLRPSCISTDDLARWLRPVDAGEMIMVVDACQSAASVEQEGFKPGPMGSRGFGQLAWNKKMRILAASQASEYALESRKLRHGLLTYALVREGLEGSVADAGDTPDGVITVLEWLRYGVLRVPKLAEAIARGDMQAVGPRGPLRSESLPEPSGVVQRPALFDFRRTGSRETVLRSR